MVIRNGQRVMQCKGRSNVMQGVQGHQRGLEGELKLPWCPFRSAHLNIAHGRTTQNCQCACSLHFGSTVNLILGRHCCQLTSSPLKGDHYWHPNANIVPKYILPETLSLVRVSLKVWHNNNGFVRKKLYGRLSHQVEMNKKYL